MGLQSTEIYLKTKYFYACRNEPLLHTDALRPLFLGFPGEKTRAGCWKNMEKLVTRDLQAFRVLSKQFKWMFCSSKLFEERSIAFQVNKCGKRLSRRRKFILLSFKSSCLFMR